MRKIPRRDSLDSGARKAFRSVSTPKPAPVKPATVPKQAKLAKTSLDDEVPTFKRKKRPMSAYKHLLDTPKKAAPSKAKPAPKATTRMKINGKARGKQLKDAFKW